MQYNQKIYEMSIEEFSKALRDMSAMELLSHWVRCGKQNSFANAIMSEFRRRNIIKTGTIVEA